MSTCISVLGEYGDHELTKADEPFTCQRCFVFDEAAATAEINRLRAEVKHWKDHAEEAGRGFGEVCKIYARVSARNRALVDGILRLADSIHGDTGWDHNSGCEGEPDCFACIEADLRRLAESTPPTAETTADQGGAS